MIPDSDLLVTSLLIIISPGAGTIITLSAGLRQGIRSAIVTAAGCTVGILPHMLAAITGLATLLHTYPLVFSLIKYLGVAYLLYMAWQTLRDKELLSACSLGPTMSYSSLVRQAVVANLLNPKLSLFFLAFLPQFVSTQDAHATRNMLMLSAVFAAMTFFVFSLYGMFASSVSEKLLGSRRVMTCVRWAMALAFIAVGVKLAIAVQ